MNALSNTQNPDSPETAMTRRATFEAGTAIFMCGDERNYAYIVESGEVHIKDLDEDGNEQLVCTLGPGEIFGEMALIDRGPRTASAYAAGETNVFVISRRIMQDRVNFIDPLLGLLVNLLVERYRSARQVLPESVGADHAGALTRHMVGGSSSGSSPAYQNIQEQRTQALEDLRMEQELRRGLEQREFVPFLQPILHLPDKRIAGFEALIRWNHPEKGIVAPFHFIPVAERTNVVQLLDHMMLEKVCGILPSLMEDAGRKKGDFFISVNLSGINFDDAAIVASIGETLKKTGVNPANVKLEVTESALVGDPDHAEKILHGLKGLGVSIALDDFGTGYSSLGYLHRFPIDIIKIDRSFVSKLKTNTKSIDIVRAIVGLAKNFRQEVVAEGIENEEEALVLAGLGCDMGQGYLYGKPMEVESARAFIHEGGAA